MSKETVEIEGEVIEESKELAVAPEAEIVLPMPVAIERVIERQDATQEIVKRVLKDGVHYGMIPGTPKKTLLKPGFDVLCSTFQLAPDYEQMSGTIERDDFINIVYKCTLTHIPSGKVVASGVGSANSKEEKYRWKRAERKCPDCGQPTIRQSKEEYGGGFYCNAKDGGCGHKFAKNDTRITEQPAGKVENDNPWNFHNTLTKMSQKRGGVASIISACGLSNDFTQDMEDMADNEAAAPEAVSPPAPAPKQTAKSTSTKEEKLDLVKAMTDRRFTKDEAKAALVGVTGKDDINALTSGEIKKVIDSLPPLEAKS